MRVRRLLAGLQPRAVVGAAADGGDLIVLEAALAIPNGPAAHVILPTTREVFRDDSVTPDWQPRFDTALEEIESRGGTVESLGLEPGEAAYRRANQAMLDRAGTLADDGERAAALVIARPGEGEMIKDLVTRAEARPNVRDLMTHDPVTVTVDDDAEAVARRVAESHHNHLPVVDGEGRLAGMVTRADALAALVG